MPDIARITIRDSRDDDIEAITAIYAHHVLFGTASFETEPPSSDDMRRRRADVVAKGFPHLVAASGGPGAVSGGLVASSAGPVAVSAGTVAASVGLPATLPGLVTSSAGAILGYAYAGTYRPRAAYRDTVENSIYIRHDQIGQGIGARLLPALIARCEAIGLRQMIAVVGDSGNAASIRLHERCGFALIGTLRSVGYKHGRWLDSVLLQRSLGDGDASPPSRA
jgi:L-amino acid N-acyltransferase YncA